jgi:hypothetical protein
MVQPVRNQILFDGLIVCISLFALTLLFSDTAIEFLQRNRIVDPRFEVFFLSIGLKLSFWVFLFYLLVQITRASVLKVRTYIILLLLCTPLLAHIVMLSSMTTADMRPSFLEMSLFPFLIAFDFVTAIFEQRVPIIALSNKFMFLHSGMRVYVGTLTVLYLALPTVTLFLSLKLAKIPMLRKNKLEAVT